MNGNISGWRNRKPMHRRIEICRFFIPPLLCSRCFDLGVFVGFFGVLQDDPYWTLKYMSAQERWAMENESVCSLEQMLHLASVYNCSALFTLRRPPPGHPHHLNWVNLTLTTVLHSGIPQHLVTINVLSFHTYQK